MTGIANTKGSILYDSTCESVGTRVQDGDHLIRAAVKAYDTCATWRGISRKALVLRDKAVRQEKFLVAFIHDTIHNDAQRELENCG
jgi:hypothetical protein